MPSEGNLSFVVGKPDPLAAERSRQEWAMAVPVELDRVVCSRQVHGNIVATVRDTDAGRNGGRSGDVLTGFDALITATTNLPLMVLSADCVPMLFYDPVRHAAGAAHAGWRGTVKDIAGAVVRRMQEEFGSDPADLLVGLGPSIGPCCYEVGAEVVEAWIDSGLDARRKAVVVAGGRLIFDLWTANEIALTSAGVMPEQIERAEICTRCHAERFFSLRADNGIRGLFGAIIALNDERDAVRKGTAE